MLLQLVFSALLSSNITIPQNQHFPDLSSGQFLSGKYLDASASNGIGGASGDVNARTWTEIVPKPSDLGVFRSVAISAARLPAAVKWQEARETDYSALFSTTCNASGLAGCDSNFAKKIQALSGEAPGLADDAMLDLVNRTVNNAMTYGEDEVVWGVSDYWANPVEMAEKGAGDCEDYAIAKYWALRGLGVPDEQMQLVMLQDVQRQLFHAVLVVHASSGAYVLDNVTNRLETDIAYAQYQPIMSFSGERSYIHGFTEGRTAVAALPKDLSAISPGSGL